MIKPVSGNGVGWSFDLLAERIVFVDDNIMNIAKLDRFFFKHTDKIALALLTIRKEAGTRILVGKLKLHIVVVQLDFCVS